MPTKPSRVSVLDNVGDQFAPPGSEPWARWMLGQAKLRRQDLQRDVTGLQEIIKKLEKHGAWKVLGFLSLGTLCHAELDLDDREVDLIRTAEEGATLGVVLSKAQQLAADKAVKPLALTPGNPTGKNRNGDNVTIPKGNSAAYLVRRLKRDAPEVAQALARGEYPSARAAGIAAGIVKVPTPLDLGKRAWSKMSQKERTKFLAWLYTPEANEE